MCCNIGWANVPQRVETEWRPMKLKHKPFFCTLNAATEIVNAPGVDYAANNQLNCSQPHIQTEAVTATARKMCLENIPVLMNTLRSIKSA